MRQKFHSLMAKHIAGYYGRVISNKVFRRTLMQQSNLVAKGSTFSERRQRYERLPLSILPLGTVLRSLATATISSSPLMLTFVLRILYALADGKSTLLSLDHNPVLRYVLKKSFYAQFCAGENSTEVGQTLARLKSMGFAGVVLGYAKEVLVSQGDVKSSLECATGIEGTNAHNSEAGIWAEGTRNTVRMAQAGDFVSVKLTGAGNLGLQLLHERLLSTYLMQEIDTICELARDRGIRICFDAEQDKFQDGIDDVVMQLMRKYNTSSSTSVYNTYQMYKKVTPAVLSRHLSEAQRDGFTLGVKLVRGAYLGLDAREKFFGTKQETDACYDTAAASLLTRQYNNVVTGEGSYPNVHLILATHNLASVRAARKICKGGGAQSEIAFAQLQGMADEVSCELLDANRAGDSMTPASSRLSVYRYLVWGNVSECTKYLVRRAQENMDAVQRNRSCRNAMFVEVIRRCKKSLGLA